MESFEMLMTISLIRKRPDETESVAIWPKPRASRASIRVAKRPVSALVASRSKTTFSARSGGRFCNVSRICGVSPSISNCKAWMYPALMEAAPCRALIKMDLSEVSRRARSVMFLTSVSRRSLTTLAFCASVFVLSVSRPARTRSTACDVTSFRVSWDVRKRRARTFISEGDKVINSA